MKKPTMIYRSLLRDAWLVTWQRKSLWVFGIFAGLLFSGGVIDMMLSGFHKITQTGSLLQHLMNQSFIGYDYLSQFLLYLAQVNPNQVKIVLLFIVLATLGLISAGVISQSALIHASGSAPAHAHRIRRDVLPHFWNVLLLNILVKTLSALFITLVTLSILLFGLVGNQAYSIVFIHFLFYIPTVIFIHILFMLTLIAVVETHCSLLQGVHSAWKLFKKQWFSALEFSMILFMLVLGATVMLSVGASLISFVFGPVIKQLFIFSPSFVIWFSSLFLAMCFAAVFLTFGGMVVTFQYSAWRMFYARAAHRIHGRNPFAKLFRWLFA